MCHDCSCGQSEAPRLLPLQTSLLQHHDAQLAPLRSRFRAAGVRVVNLLSAPGSGKTALLEALARRFDPRQRVAALVGDLATDHDARRLQAAGLPAVAISTGQACHLEAAMLAEGLHRLSHAGIDPDRLDLLLIENVGNLVCPAAYDLGEDLRLVLLSVTEGEDKPLKYAPMFHTADRVVITKSDLAEVVGFDEQAVRAAVARVAPRAQLLVTSARSGAGLDALAATLLP